MFESSTQIRVHYALTDQMGVVYHGYYAEFFEIGRTEALRSLGLTYKEMEAEGIIMPVVDFQAKFIYPIRYDELITVRTTLKEIPQHHKIIFHSDVLNEAGRVATTGSVTLFFMEAANMKRAEMPATLKEKLQPYFTGHPKP